MLKLSTMKKLIIILNISAVIAFLAVLIKVQDFEMAIVIAIVLFGVMAVIDTLFLLEYRYKPVAPKADTPFCLRCTYIGGLDLPESKATVEALSDHMVIQILSHKYSLSYDKLLSIDALNKEQTEYVVKTGVGRAITGALLFGEVGAIIGAMPQTETRITTERYTLIAYNKDDTVQFITLKDLDCNKLKAEVEKFKPLSVQEFEL